MEENSPIRVLNIGNIANNAFLMSKLLRTRGIISYTISPEYTHIMGYPLWEESEFELEEKYHFAPNFTKQELEIYPWFASGNWEECIDKIQGAGSLGDTKTSITYPQYSKSKQALRQHLNRLRMSAKKFLPPSLQVWISENLIYFYRRRRESKWFEELEPLFDYFIFYGPYTYLIDSHQRSTRFISMEHGTLREYVEQPYRKPKASLKGYLNSGSILVTNQDCLPKAERLIRNQQSIHCVPHPNWDLDFPSIRHTRIGKLDHIIENPRLLFPARHTYGNPVDQGKGTKEMLWAIVELVKRWPHLKVSLIRWGNDVHKSIEFLNRQGVGDKVDWLELQSRPKLRTTIAESFAIVDQMKIAAYGALTADALGLGVPVLTSHACENDLAFFDSCAPVYPTKSKSDLIENVERLLHNSRHLFEHIRVSANWYDENLSSSLLLERMSKILRNE